MELIANDNVDAEDADLGVQAVQAYQIPPSPYALSLNDFSSCLIKHLNLDKPGLAQKCEEAYMKSPFHLAELWGRLQGLHHLKVDQYYGFCHKLHHQDSIREMYLFFVAQVGAYMKCKISKTLAIDGFKLYEKWAYLNYIKVNGAQPERRSTHPYYGSDAYLKQQAEKREQIMTKREAAKTNAYP
jgi:hypothetical protein